MLQYVCDNSPEVRQAAAYGLGVMAQFGGDNYRPFCTGTCAHSALCPLSPCRLFPASLPHREPFWSHFCFSLPTQSHLQHNLCLFS